MFNFVKKHCPFGASALWSNITDTLSHPQPCFDKLSQKRYICLHTVFTPASQNRKKDLVPYFSLFFERKCLKSLLADIEVVVSCLFRPAASKCHLRLAKHLVFRRFCTLFEQISLSPRQRKIFNEARLVVQKGVPRWKSPHAIVPFSTFFVHFFAALRSVQK